MKTITKLSLMAAGLLIGFVSCDKNETDAEPQQYECFYTIRPTYTSDTLTLADETYWKAIRMEFGTLRDAYVEVLKADPNQTFPMTAKDTLDLKKQVEALCSKAESKLDSKWHAYYEVEACWSDKSEIGHDLYSKTYGVPEGDNGKYQISTFNYPYWLDNFRAVYPGRHGNNPYFMKHISIWDINPESYNLEIQDRANTAIPVSLNLGVKNSKDVFIYLQAEKTEERAITDVICINSGDDPLYPSYEVKYEGRKYRMAQWAHNTNGNLNDRNGGDHLYLMYTTDYYDNRRMIDCCVSPWAGHMQTYSLGEGSRWGEMRKAIPMLQFVKEDGSAVFMTKYANVNLNACNNEKKAEIAILIEYRIN